MAREPREIAQIANEIQRYLRSHPHAADSLEGIAKWWLARQRYEDSNERVGRALKYLIESGEVQRKRLPDGGVVYINATRKDSNDENQK